MDVDSLTAGCQDCDFIIDVHGVKPPRFSKVSDLWIHPSSRKNVNHPHNINFIGTKNVLAAMRRANVAKLVRITGALVGSSTVSFATILFNMLLSMTVMWHEESEIEIRKSGVDYTSEFQCM